MSPAAEAPLELSRYCVPFTPFSRALEDATVMLVSTAAVRAKEDRPFQMEGDTSFRTIDGALDTRALTYDDAHFDHRCADADLNCIFPLDRLQELARERRIGGVAAVHFSTGYSQALRELRETTVPRLAREVDRARPDAVLLTGG